MKPEELAGALVQRENPAVVVGGFPRGHFFPRDIKAFDSLVRVHERPLDAHVVAARVTYEVERRLEEAGRSRDQG